MKKNIKNLIDDSCLQIFIVIIFLILLFLSNIVMHIVTVKRTEIMPFTMESINGYERFDNKYTLSGEGAYLEYNINSDYYMNEVSLSFGGNLDTEKSIKVYYPNESGQYVPENVATDILRVGQDKIAISLPTNHYSSLRICIDGKFRLKNVCGKVAVLKMAYSYADIRYTVWGCCALIAIIGAMLVYLIEGINVWLNHRYNCIIQKKFRFIKWKSLKKGIFVIFTSLVLGTIFAALLAFICNFQNSFEIVLFCSFVILFVLSLLFFREAYQHHIERIVFLILTCVGILFACVLPASLRLSWDDQIHYNGAVAVARLNTKTMTAAEQLFYMNHVKATYDYNIFLDSQQQTDLRTYDQLYKIGDCHEKIEQKIKYKSIGYTPAVLGIWISYGLCLPFSVSIIFIRIFSVMFYAGVISLAMKKIKSGKMLFAVFAMIPIVAFLCCSFSYDSWIFIILIYGFSRYWRELQEKDNVLTMRHFLGIFIPLFLAILPKIVYAPILFLTAYMPKKKFKEIKWCYAYRACFVVAGICVVLVIVYVLNVPIDLGIGDTRGGAVNATQQLQYILENKAEYFQILSGFLKKYFDYNNTTYMTSLAYVGGTKLQIVPILLLLFVAFTNRNSEDKRMYPFVWKIGAVFMYIIIGAICATSMYILFTPFASQSISGCQGRYILPTIIPVLFSITRFGSFTDIRSGWIKRYYNQIVLSVSVMFLLYTIWDCCIVAYM